MNLTNQLRIPAGLVAMAWAVGYAGAPDMRTLPPMISKDARQLYGVALREASKGQSALAVSVMEGLLLQKPVTVGVDRSTLPESLAAAYELAVQRGIDTWTEALGEPTFSYLPEGKPSIVVKFVDSVPDAHDVQGQVDAHFVADVQKRSSTFTLTATVRVVRRAEGRFLRDGEVVQVVAHELGHLLGLDDGPRHRGLMGPFISGRPRMLPSAEEIEALQAFRARVRASIAEVQRAPARRA